MRTLVKVHESLRSALNYRIQNGTMTVSLMARSTGLSQSHVSTSSMASANSRSKRWTRL